MMWTDPPYGVDYTGKTPAALTIRNDGGAQLAQLLADSFTAADGALKPGARFYLAAPPGPREFDFHQAIGATGWKLHQGLVWVKDQFVLGHSDYHYRHEPILYGYKPGPGRAGRGNHKGSRWYADHSQDSVFEVARPKASRDHPTMKPVALIEACLRNSSLPADLVLEPFAGSGSTLIACENLGRRCYAIEIDPAYCDVIVDRWERHSGQKATRT